MVSLCGSRADELRGPHRDEGNFTPDLVTTIPSCLYTDGGILNFQSIYFSSNKKGDRTALKNRALYHSRFGNRLAVYRQTELLRQGIPPDCRI